MTRTRLLLADDVAGAADLKVSVRQLEARPELFQFLNSLKSSQRIRRDTFVPGVQEVSEGVSGGPPDSPAQLVEGRESEQLGLGYDDGIG